MQVDDKKLQRLIGAAQAALIVLGQQDGEWPRQAKEELRAAIEDIERLTADKKIKE